MMDVCYYNEQIREELDGACDYIKRAISCKKKNPDHAALLAQMSLQELGHADNLVKMFEDDYQTASDDTEDGDLPYLKAFHKALLDMYTEGAAKIKYMHEKFNGK